MEQILTFFAAVVGGFLMLVWGADRFVLGAAATARNLGISPLIIGLTIVGFGTSAPEVLVGAMAAIGNAPGLAIGNAVGSNIANIALVLGVTALIKPLNVRSETVRKEIPLMLAITLGAGVLFLDGRMSLFDGLLMVVAFVVLMAWVVRIGINSSASDPAGGEYDAEIRNDLSMAAALSWTGLGFIVLLAGAQLLVWGGTELAVAIGVSDVVIGVTIVAVGTSLPELAVCVAGARKDEHDLVLGNILGSNMFNLLAVIGVATLLRPFDIEPSVLTFHFPVMLILSLALFAMAYNLRGGPGRITRFEGIILLFAFAAYHFRVYQTALPGAMASATGGVG